MTHPDILTIERFGYLHPESEPVVVGYCCQCGQPLYDDEENLEDEDGLLWCDTDCLMKYYGVHMN